MINWRSRLTNLAHETLRDVKEPTHSSKRVGDIVPIVVVYLHLHHHSSRVGKVQWAHKNGLIAAAIGALSMLTSEPTAKSNVKRTRTVPLTSKLPPLVSFLVRRDSRLTRTIEAYIL